MIPFAPPSDLRIRAARPDDAEALGTLWARAFPGERPAADRTESLLAGTDTYGGLDTCRVAELDGRMAGACRAYSLTLSLFGRPVPALGLGAVAVSPDARRRGIGAELCRDALRVGRERGDLVSVLYPFRVEFYRRMGWALAGSVERYRFPPEALPRFPERSRARLLEPAERRPAVPELYRSLLPGRHGLLHRSARHWKLLDDPALLVVGVEADPGEGTLAAAAILESRRGRGGTGPALTVRESYVSDPSSYRALLGWLSVQRDQWRSITLDALPGERLHQVLAEPRRPGRGARRGLWFESAVLLRGPMIRVIDLAGLAAHFGVRPGTRLEVADPEVPEQAGVWVADDEAGLRRTDAEPGSGALPMALLSGLVVAGELPGVGIPPPEFEPAMGIGDFDLLDTF